MRTSTLSYEEALEIVDSYLNSCNKDIYVENSSADCATFPCPEELGSWCGETNAIYVYDVSTGEELFACAYWQ